MPKGLVRYFFLLAACTKELSFHFRLPANLSSQAAAPVFQSGENFLSWTLAKDLFFLKFQ